MNFQINNNGSDPDDLIKRYRAVHAAALDLLAALANAYPHERNYQTTDDPRSLLNEDVQETFCQMCATQDIKFWAVQAAQRVMEQKLNV